MAKRIDKLITVHIQDLNCFHLTLHKNATVTEAVLDVEDDEKYAVAAFTPKEAKKLGQALIDVAKGKLDTDYSVAEAEMPEED